MASVVQQRRSEDLPLNALLPRACAALPADARGCTPNSGGIIQGPQERTFATPPNRATMPEQHENFGLKVTGVAGASRRTRTCPLFPETGPRRACHCSLHESVLPPFDIICVKLPSGRLCSMSSWASIRSKYFAVLDDLLLSRRHD
jgi:hypothetical protein